MGKKAGVSKDKGIIFSDLPIWAVIGLGITMALKALHSSCKAREEHDNDNRIDRLPDDILGNIVSRLRPTEASRTSILSRRWRNIWTMNHKMISSCLYTLDIFRKYHDHVAHDDKERFLNAVNQRLQLYSRRKLKVFFMHCCFLNDHTDHLVQWMQTLASLDVAELYLGHSCETCNGDPLDKAFTFSFKLIDGLSRLKHLDLKSCYVESSLGSHCNSLVSLSLSHLPLLSHNLSDILLSCPNLQSLGMIHCALPLNLRISGPNLKLKNLVLLVCHNVQKLEISDINVMTLKIDIRNEVEVLLSSVPKLGRLHLRTPKMNHRFGHLQRDLPQLKYLLVQTSYQIMRLPPTFRVFRNIKVLILMTRGYPYPEACEEVDLWNFAPVLGACPLLEEFFLEIGGRACKQERKAEEWPVLRHQHLRLMELSGFSNTQNEFEFAKFIITSAQVLKCLRLRLSCRRFNFDDFYFEDVKDSEQIDIEVAEAVCANLHGHALSMRAGVELLS